MNRLLASSLLLVSLGWIAPTQSASAFQSVDASIDSARISNYRNKVQSRAGLARAKISARLAVAAASGQFDLKALEEVRKIDKALGDLQELMPKLSDEGVDQMRRALDPVRHLKDIRDHNASIPAGYVGTPPPIAQQSQLASGCGPGYPGGTFAGPVGQLIGDLLFYLADGFSDADDETESGATFSGVALTLADALTFPPGLQGELDCKNAQTIIDYLAELMPEVSFGIAFIIDISMTIPSPLKAIFQGIALLNERECLLAEIKNTEADNCQANSLSQRMDTALAELTDIKNRIQNREFNLVNRITDVKNTVISSTTTINNNIGSNTNLIRNDINASRVFLQNLIEISKNEILVTVDYARTYLDARLFQTEINLTNNANANKQMLVDLALRLAIEEDLARDTKPIASFVLPAAQGGYCELVAQIVAEAIQRVQNGTGYPQTTALLNLSLANAAHANGQYWQAYYLCRTAYQIVSGGS